MVMVMVMVMMAMVMVMMMMCERESGREHGNAHVYVRQRCERSWEEGGGVEGAMVASTHKTPMGKVAQKCSQAAFAALAGLARRAGPLGIGRDQVIAVADHSRGGQGELGEPRLVCFRRPNFRWIPIPLEVPLHVVLVQAQLPELLAAMHAPWDHILACRQRFDRRLHLQGRLAGPAHVDANCCGCVHCRGCHQQALRETRRLRFPLTSTEPLLTQQEFTTVACCVVTAVGVRGDT